MAFHRNFASVPIPIRLTCQYSNGITLRIYARALSCNPRSLRVLCSQPFEPGVELNILAPFWRGICSCSVASAVRSKKQAAYFELDLKLLGKPAPVGEEGSDVPESAAPLAASTTPSKLADAAAELADDLEQSGSAFPAAWSNLPASRRSSRCMTLAMALLLLLQEKGHADLNETLSAGNPKSQLPPEEAERSL